MEASKRLDRPISHQSTSPSESSQDRGFFVSYGLIISTRLRDVDRIREAVKELGGKIIFQTVTSAPLYLLRGYQVERILQGDLSELLEAYARKQKERRSEK